MIRTKSWILIVIAVILLLITSVLLLRQPLLEYVVSKAKAKFKEKFDVNLEIGDVGFAGIRDVYIHDLVLIPANGDTLLTVRNVYARISISKLLRFKVGLRELMVDTTHLSLVRRDSSNNFSFLKQRKNESVDDTSQVVNATHFNERFMSILEKVNDVFNERITFRQFKVSYSRGDLTEFVSIPELLFDGSIFQSSVITSSKEGVNLWILHGTVNASNNSYSFNVKRTRGNSFALPFVDLFDGFKLCIDSAQVNLKVEEADGKVDIKGKFNLNNLMVNHWRISPKDVRFPSMGFVMNASVDRDSLSLNKGTVFTLNTLPIEISTSYSRVPERRFRLHSTFETEDAQQFFDALPEGMFYTLQGFKASGGLKYELLCDVPFDRPNDLIFNSSMANDHLKIKSYGTENFGKINVPFSFIAMDGERAVRSFTVGPENPFFAPLQYVSPYLVNAVLTCEDPSFMQHGGFVTESFRESLVTNLKEKRFARGGSTISMQLVKNVFLSRNKSISRKLEEVLIVWLMERQHIVPKERMLEVYLNIIEWGPNVYGVGEAARFYFDKSPDELNLSESIFMASLIPSPKHFRYRFDAQGNLKSHVLNFINMVSNRLVIREKISQAEADSLQGNVQLKGPAMNVFVPLDSLDKDSTLLLPLH